MGIRTSFGFNLNLELTRIIINIMRSIWAIPINLPLKPLNRLINEETTVNKVVI